MYQTVKQQVKHLTKKEYRTLKYLCHIAKNLANEAIYNVRQHYFHEKKYLNYNQNWQYLKDSVNYKKLQVYLAQQVIRKTDEIFKSFFALLRLKRAGKYTGNVNIPSYLRKDGFMTLRITDFNLNNGSLTIPYSGEYRRKHERISIRVPEILRDKKVRVVRIVPKAKARYFEVQYVYEAEESQSETDSTKALAIDLGISNLATCITNTGESFIIDGRRLKSIKENARLENRTGKIVLGYNPGIQTGNKLGHVINQIFIQIPFGKLRDRIRELSGGCGLVYHEQEERTDGRKINADINGALIILRKSNVVSIEGLYGRGELDTPARIRFA